MILLNKKFMVALMIFAVILFFIGMGYLISTFSSLKNDPVRDIPMCCDTMIEVKNETIIINNITINNITTNNIIKEIIKENCNQTTDKVITDTLNDKERLSLIKQIQFLERLNNAYNETNCTHDFINLSHEYKLLENNYTKCESDLKNLSDFCWG